MIQAIDHIVILVNDLGAATASYAALGFTVAPGGTHAGGATHNALVVFEDDTYLELIAFLRDAPEHHWWPHAAAGEGLIDYALLPSAIAADVAAARARGLVIDGPYDGGRVRPDGQRVAWQSARPAAAGLPFLCGDVTPRALRVPAGALRTHANGVTGIAGVTVATPDLTATAAQYQALLGSDAAGSSFALGAAAIVLATPGGGAIPGATLAAHLARRGAGLCALTLRGPRPTAFEPALTHGVPIDVVA